MKRTTKYVALDVHQASTVASVREESGRVIARSAGAARESCGRLRSARGAAGPSAESQIEPWFARARSRALAMRSVRIGSSSEEENDAFTSTSRGLPQLGRHRQLAKLLKAIAYAKVKTDAVDSTTLAHLLRAGLVPEAHMISAAWSARRVADPLAPGRTPDAVREHDHRPAG